MDEYQSKFQEDALELLTEIEGLLLLLEESPSDKSLIEGIFRNVHTIKGAANMFGLTVIGNLTHQIENLYEEVREGRLLIDGEIIELTLSSIDHIRRLFNDIELQNQQNKGKHQEIELKLKEVIDNNLSGTDLNTSQSSVKIRTYYLQVKAVNPDVSENSTFYLFNELQELGRTSITKKLDGDNLLLWKAVIATHTGLEGIEGVFLFADDQVTTEIHPLAEEDLFGKEGFQELLDSCPNGGEDLLSLLEAFVKGQHLNSDNKNIITDGEGLKRPGIVPPLDGPGSKTDSLKVEKAKVDQMMSWVSELITMQASIQSLSKAHNIPELSTASEKMEIITDQLRSTVFSISLLTIDILTNRFSRLVRDLSKELGKTVRYKVEGGKTELDKNIIDQLVDPLMHVMRNCLDHGIETPEERIRAGKKPEGEIKLHAFNSGNNVCIEISDDGKGIDFELVRKKAIDKGIVQENALLTEKEITELIFEPGFSTALTVSDISGRGVGMDVVKKTIEKLKGEIVVSSQQGKGTTFSIKLPITISVIESFLVRLGKMLLLIPLSSVYKCYRVPASSVDNKTKLNKKLHIENMQMDCINLREKFRIDTQRPENLTIISSISEEEEIGIIIDSIIEKQQTVIKPIGLLFDHISFLSGVSILGDGSLAYVIDVPKLINEYKEKYQTTY